MKYYYTHKFIEYRSFKLISLLFSNIISNNVFLTVSINAGPIKIDNGDELNQIIGVHPASTLIAKAEGGKFYSVLETSPEGNLLNETQSKSNIREFFLKKIGIFSSYGTFNGQTKRLSGSVRPLPKYR